MVQINRRTIVVHDDTYETLKSFGTVAESFDDVIWKLINRAVSDLDSYHGPQGQKAARAASTIGRSKQ
jgi:predicted CopG family antitoxin